MTTLLWKPEGPLLAYKDGDFIIADLNPEQRIVWRLTPVDLMLLGGCCFGAAWISLVQLFLRRT